MEQKGIFDFILLFFSLFIWEGREKENEVAKIVIKSHTFLFHPFRMGLSRIKSAAGFDFASIFFNLISVYSTKNQHPINWKTKKQSIKFQLDF
jgi:hypothetical protein